MAIKETIGTVISNKMEKTITVAVKNQVKHKKYSKIIAQTKKYYAHDENNECIVGDIVKIKETRPISKTKKWKFVNKIII
uniref:ribosomal protein S17 n=1 Tax=Hypnea pseudomusciformis TaxID=1545697 RepID=UPI0027DA19B6|nr:ribosomal protein S17 [Hypnea pseudomusciformis]WCH55175.1 ribosomal protein S17 [Hypnea pseudomusciformis]WCH55574.1 ribosomal protein S17 [Hypnea pseudomusciformis]WCH56768.1 ribosomal protein S17 [Hypnea pseudomusciformis]